MSTRGKVYYHMLRGDGAHVHLWLCCIFFSSLILSLRWKPIIRKTRVPGDDRKKRSTGQPIVSLYQLSTDPENESSVAVLLWRKYEKINMKMKVKKIQILWRKINLKMNAERYWRDVRWWKILRICWKIRKFGDLNEFHCGRRTRAVLEKTVSQIEGRIVFKVWR